MEIRKEYNQVKSSLTDFFDVYESFILRICEGRPGLKDNYTKRLLTFDERKEQIDNNTFTVVVIGEIKHGKSTLLNALLGKPAFPKDILEATATISYMRHNDTAKDPAWRNRAVVTFWDPNKKPEPVEHTELMEYTTCLGKKLDVAEEVKEVSIYTDSEFVRDGVTIVDTPGTNTTVTKHSDITNEQIEKSNAAIFLFKAGTPGKMSDYNFLAMAATRINRFFFLVNRIDETGGIKQADRIINDIVKKMERCKDLDSLDTSRFFPTSGLLALLSRYGYIENEKFDKEEWARLDSEEFRANLLNQSGIPKFEEELLTYLFKGERIAEFFRSHLKYLSGCLKEDKQSLEDHRRVLSGKLDVTELETRRNVLELEIEKNKYRIELAASDLNEKLNQSLHDFLTEADQEITNVKDKFSEEIKQYTDFDDMEAEWSELSAQPNKLYIYTRGKILHILKNTINDVFKAQDTRLRGELNNSLQEAGIVSLPDVSGDFVPITIRKEMKPSETFDEVKELKQQLSEVTKELENSIEIEANYEILKQEKEALEAEVQNTQARAERRLAVLGSRPAPQVITRPAYTSYEDREGLFGRTRTWIFGPKAVHHPPRTEIDTTAQEHYDAEKANIAKWHQEKEKELTEKLESQKAKFNSAQIANMKRRAQEQVRAKHEQLLKAAEEKLRDEHEKAKKKTLVQNRKSLCDALEAALQQMYSDLQQTIDKCSEWANEYMTSIQEEVNEFHKTRIAEYDALQTEINMKTDEKQEALAQLDLLEEELQNLNDSFESIRNMTENVYK